MKYKVIHVEDNIYQVLSNSGYESDEVWVLFQGTLPECEAWITLKEKNYI